MTRGRWVRVWFSTDGEVVCLMGLGCCDWMDSQMNELWEDGVVALRCNMKASKCTLLVVAEIFI